jgi:cellulose synthase/poly-beta-1,6-N-acetylglucosamine synthase-like glycosyltransferase
MYKEPEVAQKIARTVTSLDYPIDKLDVKLLLEEDDHATRAKIDEVVGSLPPCVEVILAPIVAKGQPRTEPRACNWGLEQRVDRTWSAVRCRRPARARSAQESGRGFQAA